MIDKTTPRGTTVRICDNPQCGHSGGLIGRLDLHGTMVDSSLKDRKERLAIVIVQGGGARGPFRYEELTPLKERRLEIIEPATEKCGAVMKDLDTGQRLECCYGCGRPRDEHINTLCPTPSGTGNKTPGSE